MSEVLTRKVLRVSLIGAGARANACVYPALQKIDGVEILSVFDIDRSAAQAAANKFGIPKCYSGLPNDFKKMLEESKPDAVFSIGQPHMMYDNWVWCLENGFHLFIEKPLGLTLH
jgi:virulence factor